MPSKGKPAMMAQTQSSPSRHRSLAPLLCGLREGNPGKQTQMTLPGGKPEPGHPTCSLATGIVAGAIQWLFWNPWAFIPALGSLSRRSYSMVSKSRAPPPLPTEQDTSPGAKTGDEYQDPALRDPSDAEGKEQCPLPVQASSSSR